MIKLHTEKYCDDCANFEVDAVIKDINKDKCNFLVICKHAGKCNELYKQIKKEVPCGQWISHIDDLSPVESTIECSVCHAEETIHLQNTNYCPNCGAKMDERER